MHFFGRLTYVHGMFSMTKLFAAPPPPEWLLPIDGIIVKNNGCTCNVQLARISHGFAGFLCLPEMAPDDLMACFVLCDMSAYLAFFKSKLIYFYTKKRNQSTNN